MSDEGKWVKRYFDLAHHIAGWSKDPSTKVGAVIVGEDPRKIAFGYNGFPPGIEDFPERLENREMKYKLTQHAERNVLDCVAFDTEGATLIVTMHPCSECAKSIVTKRIRRVICPPPTVREPWGEDAVWSQLIMREAGVELCIVKGET
jgi:dCMP deaminase